MTTQTSDPFDTAMNTEYRPTKMFFGQVSVDVYYCVLIKGKGKEVFDPNQHKQDMRRTSISIAIDPLPGSRAQFSVERELIAESKEWAQIIKPSLRALNTDLRAINHKWAQVELVPTGQTYTDNNGETKERTTVKFIRIFDSEGECIQAANDYFGHQAEPAETEPQPQPASNPERDVAARFIEPMWNACSHDVQKFQERLATDPLLSKYFTIESPEVTAVISPS